MKHHVWYYISLFLVLAMGFGMSVYLASQKELQMSLIVLTAFFYVVWGVMHHIIHHSFSIKIMLEYIAIATLGISLILFVLNIGL